MNQAAQKPDIEITRKITKDGMFQRSLVIIYWKPLFVWAFGKKVIDFRSRYNKEIMEAETVKNALEQKELETLKRVYREVISNGSHTQGSILHYLAKEISKITGVNEVQQNP